MADFKDERAYNSKTLTQWFLGSSLLLLVCVMFMAYFDYHRPWKDYQRRFMRMQRRVDIDQRNEVNAQVDVARYKQLTDALKAADEDINSQKGSLGDLASKQASLDAKIYKVNSDYQMLKANVDADKYTYSEGLKNGKDDQKFKKHLDEEIDGAGALNQKLFEMRQDRDQTVKDMAAITAKRDDVQAQITKMRAEYDGLQKKIKSLSFNFLFYFRNAMLLDFMSPTIQIQQVVLKNLPEDLYFAKTMRVDRCMSCHLGIDKKGFDEEHFPNIPKVFQSHPHLELYVGSTSPHPMDKVGCTICHGGMGPSLTFNSCAHVPNDEEEAKRWKKDPHLKYKEPEAVQSSMLPLKFTEGSCLKCHGIQEKVNFAEKLNRGRELMVIRGCVGCHKVKNLEGLTKAGPVLYKVKGKLKKDFVLKWVWAPKSYNPSAKMPSFFQQTNNSDPEIMAKNKAELNAIVDYIYDKSEDYSPNLAPGAGSVSEGKKLFKEVGCLACHGINDVTTHHADFAPDLSSVGSKLSAAFIYSWIKNPQHFNPDSRMPSLRLSDQEASNITAYLMSKRNKDFEEASAPDFDPSVRDWLIVDYLTPQIGEGAANAKLLTMDEKSRQMFLGEKSLGKYACFACHIIKGFETSPGIGTELSTWGTKRVSQLDFGFSDPKDIHHTHEGFLEAKLRNPRQFDKDKVSAFRDLLKMPNFYLSDEDREAIMTAVLGLTQTYVPGDMTAGISGNGPLLEKGRRVIADFNCRGCHLIEDQGGKIREMYTKENIDLSLAPPNLKKEGAKIQIEWFHNFLLGVHPIRPWLHIRMPSFPWTDEKISNVITYFNLKEDQVYPFKTITARKLKGNDLTQAKALFNKLQCAKCHIVGAKMPSDMSTAAPDLLQVHNRLKPDWIVDWLGSPQGMSDQFTRMPGFWQADQPAPDAKAFGGDGLKQREALRDYLFMLGKGETN